MGDQRESGDKKRGRKKWTLRNRLGGLLRGDTRPKGIFSFPIRLLYSRSVNPRRQDSSNTNSRPSTQPPELTKEVPTEDELEDIENRFNLTEDQQWALLFLMTQIRYALLIGDSRVLREIANGMDYRAQFLNQMENPGEGNDLEMRLYEAYLIFRSDDPRRGEPSRREAKRIAVEKWLASEQSKRHMTESEIRDFGDRIKNLQWSRAFNRLALNGIFEERGKPGAPRKDS